MASRESFYVQVSRHRESCELFVDVSQSKNREAGYQEFLSSITRTTRECLAVDFKKELRARQQKEEEARRWYPVEMRAEDLAQNIRKGALSTLEHRYESLARVYYNAPRPISEEEARRKAYEQVTGGNWQKTQDEVQELERRVNVKKAGLEDVHYHAKYHRGWVYRTFSSKYRRDVEAGERAVKDATQRFEEAKLRWQKMESSVLHGEKSKEAEGIAEKIVDDNQQAIHRAVSVRSELLRVQEQRDRMRIVVQGLELLGTEKVQCRKNGKGQLEITDRNAAHRAAKAYQLEQKRERGIGRGR